MKDNRNKVIGTEDPINPKMGEGRYQDALRRLRDRIAGGIELNLEDSTEIGNKYTYCSWGMCSEDKEQWPDKDDHTFPNDFERYGRMSRRDIPYCPLDTRKSRIKNSDRIYWGCFYKCRAFHQHQYGKLTREKTLELFNNYIKFREEKYGRKTAEMDHEPWRK